MAESDEPVHLVEREETGDRFLIYTDDRGLRVDLRYEGDALWMTQAQMSQLFGIDVRTVNEHLQNVYREGELDEGATIRNFRIVRSEGARAVSREILHYNLDAVISVGYRVSSAQGTLFLKWATGVLVQFKEPGHQDRITELRDIIRDIRSSEANVYSELRRICAMCQDYDPSSDASRRFYQQMQAKLFYAVTNRTPADIVGSRSDADQPNMGLQTWSKAEVTKADAMVAKNYLAQPEIKELNRLTTIMLDIFDDQLDIGKLTTMAEAEELLERQLINLRRIVLRHGGNISSDAAKAKAAREYKRFDERRKRDRAVETARELAALKAADKSLPKVRAAKTKK